MAKSVNLLKSYCNFCLKYKEITERWPTYKVCIDFICNDRRFVSVGYIQYISDVRAGEH